MRLPIVNQKEVVPVRLVPIITARNIGQQRLAGILTHKLRVNGFPRISSYDGISVSVDGAVETINKFQLVGSSSNDVDIYAYHLNENGEPVRMLSTEWDDIYQEISILEPILRKEEEMNGIPDSKETTWLIESLKILPPGVFLWREDTDKLWQVYNKQLSMPGERKDSRILNYDAYVMPKYRELVFEGFEEILAENNPKYQADGLIPKNKMNSKIENSLLKMIIAMAIDAYGYNPADKKSTTNSDISLALENVELPLSENTIRTHLKAAAELLSSDYFEKNQ